MPNFLMAMAARSIASSALADPCVIVTRDGAFPTRATTVHREVTDDQGRVLKETVIRVPLADLPGAPAQGDAVDFDGKARWVLEAKAAVTTVEIWLTDREPSSRRGGDRART